MQNICNRLIILCENPSLQMHEKEFDSWMPRLWCYVNACYVLIIEAVDCVLCFVFPHTRWIYFGSLDTYYTQATLVISTFNNLPTVISFHNEQVLF